MVTGFKLTLTNWIRDGVAPPSIKLGKHRLFNREKLRAWVIARERQAANRRSVHTRDAEARDERHGICKIKARQ
jgi:hypothetical protein